MARLLTTFLLLFAWAPVLHADPLDRRTLPAGAVWFVHLDLDAARESSLGQNFRDLLLSRPDSAKAIEQARQGLGIDLTRDIQSVTVYGTTFAPDTGVVIARGKVDREKLENLLRAAPGYRAESIDGHALYFWNETDPNRRHNSAGAFFGEDRMVIAPDGPAVIAALQVLEGKGASLSPDSGLGAQIAPGAIAQAAATGLSEAKELSIQSPIIRQCESGSLSLSEQNGLASLHGRIETQSPDTAGQLYKLIQGAQALGQLQASDNADLANLLRPLTVTIKEKSVEIQWQYSVAELVKIVQHQEARKLAATQPGKEQ